MRRPWKTALGLLLACACASAADFQKGMADKKADRLPEAEAEFEALAAQNPKDAEVLEQLATVQGWQGRYADAILSWKRALAVKPGSAEYRVGLARVYYWSQAPQLALRELDIAVASEPRNFDAQALRGDVLMALGRTADARAAYLKAQALSPQDAGLGKKIAGAAPPPTWRFDAGASADHFSALRSHEGAFYGQAGYLFNRSDNLWLREDVMKEFGQVDKMTQLGGALLINQRLLLLPSVGATPSPHFRPETQAELGAEVIVDSYVTPLWDSRYFHYADGDVLMAIPGLRLQLAPWLNAEYRFSLSHNTDATTTESNSIKLNFALKDELAPYLAYAHGIEDLPPLASATVSYYSAGCVWSPAPDWGFRIDFVYEDRLAFYRHTSLGGGFTYKL